MLTYSVQIPDPFIQVTPLHVDDVTSPDGTYSADNGDVMVMVCFGHVHHINLEFGLSIQTTYNTHNEKQHHETFCDVISDPAVLHSLVLCNVH